MAAAITLFHVSDLHFGQEDRAALDWFARLVERERPAAVICTGDLTMRGTAREFALAQSWLRLLPVPVLIEPGNHDLPYYWNPVARMLRPYHRFAALQAAIQSDLALPGIAPDIAIVPLKTVGRAQLRLNWSKGRVRRHELTRTLADLADHAAKPLRLVICHHPLVGADLHRPGSTHGGRDALAALARAGANAVLSGHVHDAFDREAQVEGRAIRIIGAGTLSQRIRRSPPSFNQLNWVDRQLTVTLRQIS